MSLMWRCFLLDVPTISDNFSNFSRYVASKQEGGRPTPKSEHLLLPCSWNTDSLAVAKSLQLRETPPIVGCIYCKHGRWGGRWGSTGWIGGASGSVETHM